jgi:hypothetical protein
MSEKRKPGRSLLHNRRNDCNIELTLENCYRTQKCTNYEVRKVRNGAGVK